MDEVWHRVERQNGENAVAGALLEGRDVPGLTETAVLGGTYEHVTDLGVDVGQVDVAVEAEPFGVDDE
jgi:hypothetical protein